MRTSWLSLLAAAALFGACAKSADQIGPTYISPIVYENYTCAQLGEEAHRISTRVAQAAGVQDQKATNDAIAMTVGLVIVWPALLFIKGNDENSAELARLRGQMDAVEQTAIRKKCGITFQRPAAQPRLKHEPDRPPNSAVAPGVQGVREDHV